MKGEGGRGKGKEKQMKGRRKKGHEGTKERKGEKGVVGKIVKLSCNSHLKLHMFTCHFTIVNYGGGFRHFACIVLRRATNASTSPHQSVFLFS